LLSKYQQEVKKGLYLYYVFSIAVARPVKS